MTTASARHTTGESPAPERNRSGPRRMILVANRTGGQGKTLVSQLLLAHLARARYPVMPLAADAQSTEPAGRGGGSSKLAKVLPGTHDLGIGRDAGLGGGAAEQLAYWDDLGSVITAVDTLLDVGANVIDPIVAWAKAADALEDLRELLVVDLVVPVTRGTQSLRDASSMVSDVLSAHALPIRNVYLVRNKWGAQEAPDAAVKGFLSEVRAIVRRTKVGDVPSITGGVALLELGSCDTTTGTRLVSEFDARFSYLGVVHDEVPKDTTLGEVPPAPAEGLSSRVAPGQSLPSSIDLDAVASEMAAKVLADRQAFVAEVGGLNVFQRARVAGKVRTWIASFSEELRDCGFDYGHPLADVAEAKAGDVELAHQMAQITDAELATLTGTEPAAKPVTEVLPL